MTKDTTKDTAKDTTKKRGAIDTTKGERIGGDDFGTYEWPDTKVHTIVGRLRSAQIAGTKYGARTRTILDAYDADTGEPTGETLGLWLSERWHVSLERHVGKLIAVTRSISGVKVAYEIRVLG